MTTVDKLDFAARMARLGPFETAPYLAVAVSGGADSMALALLAADWAGRQGGRITALTVDHGLRAESAAEAAQTGQWLAARGISHEILRWSGEKPTSDLQAAAREARYRLLADWCRTAGILHLLVAHHQDDQAETLLLRLARGSGVDGLAAMAPVLFQDNLQILRPLLELPAAALKAYLRECGQGWVEDPSNQLERFDRVQWRRWMQEAPLSPKRAAETASRMARARDALQMECAALAAASVTIHQAGFTRFDRTAWHGVAPEVTLRLLANLIRTIGGKAYVPRLDGLERLHDELRGGLARRRTLGGCVVAPEKSGQWLIYRESRAIGAPISVQAPGRYLWDGRFTFWLRGAGAWQIGALGDRANAECRRLAAAAKLPRILLPGMPAIMDKHGILQVPPLGYDGIETGGPVTAWGFSPAFPVTGFGFRLATAPGDTI